MNTTATQVQKCLNPLKNLIKDKELELPDPNPKSMFINPTNKYEIQQIIDNMKLKNGGVDKINAKTLKLISRYITETAGILHQCIETSTWPDMP